VDLWFAADPTLTYKLWARLKADGHQKPELRDAPVPPGR
jgi:hypothetical protein